MCVCGRGGGGGWGGGGGAGWREGGGGGGLRGGGAWTVDDNVGTYRHSVNVFTRILYNFTSHLQYRFSTFNVRQ